MSAIDIPERYISRVDDIEEVRSIIRDAMRPLLSNLYSRAWLIPRFRRPIHKIPGHRIVVSGREDVVTVGSEDWIPVDVFLHAPDGTVTLVNAEDGTTVSARIIVGLSAKVDAGVDVVPPSYIAVPTPAPSQNGRWRITATTGPWSLDPRLAEWLKTALDPAIFAAILDLWQEKGASAANDGIQWTIRAMSAPDVFSELDTAINLLVGADVFEARDGEILDIGAASVKTESKVYEAPSGAAPRSSLSVGDFPAPMTPVFDTVQLVDEISSPGWWMPGPAGPITVPSALMPGASTWTRRIEDRPRRLLWDSTRQSNCLGFDTATISATLPATSSTWIAGGWFRIQGAGTIMSLGGAALNVDGAGNLSLGGSVGTGEWHHIAISWNGSSGSVWVDGVEISSGWTGGTAVTSVSLGPCPGKVAEFWVEDGVSSIPYPAYVSFGEPRPSVALHLDFSRVHGAHHEGQSFSGFSYIDITGNHTRDSHGWIGMWLKIPTGAPDGMAIACVADHTSSATLKYDATTSSLVAYYSGDTSSQSVAISLDTWHHVVWMLKDIVVDPGPTTAWSPSSIWFNDFVEADLKFTVGAEAAWGGSGWTFSNYATCDVALLAVWRGTPDTVSMSRRSDPGLASLMMDDAITVPVLSGLETGLPISEIPVIQDIGGGNYNAKINGAFYLYPIDPDPVPEDLEVEAWGIGDPDLTIGSSTPGIYTLMHQIPTIGITSTLLPGDTVTLTQSDASSITVQVLRIDEPGYGCEVSVISGTPVTGSVSWTDEHGFTHTGTLDLAMDHIKGYAYRVMDKIWKHSSYAIMVSGTGLNDKTLNMIDKVVEALGPSHLYYFGRITKE